MSCNAAKRLLFIISVSLLGLVLSTCGGNNDAETDTAGEKAKEAQILTTEEQRALRAEFSIEADKQISEENFDNTLESLKKEIEADL